jgi:hypothetical protein
MLTRMPRRDPYGYPIVHRIKGCGQAEAPRRVLRPKCRQIGSFPCLGQGEFGIGINVVPIVLLILLRSESDGGSLGRSG